MQVQFSTFIGFGTRATFDVKCKSSNRILFRKELVIPLAGPSWSIDRTINERLELFFAELSLAIHKEGFQNLSAWFDKEIKSFEGEYVSTWQHDAIHFLSGLNYQVFTVDPIL